MWGLAYHTHIISIHPIYAFLIAGILLVMKQRNILLITQYALIQHTPICSEKCNDGSNLISIARYYLQFTIETLFIVYNGLLVVGIPTSDVNYAHI